MTELEQNMAIAAACGRTYHKPTDEEISRGSYYQYEPDYVHDLNAMAEAEKIVDRELYAAQLLAVIHDVGEDYFSKVSWENAHELVTATAAQRAEAFLRIIGKWKD